MGFSCIGNHDITRHHSVLSHPSSTADMEMFSSNIFIKAKNTVQTWIFLMKADKGIEFFGFLHGFLDNLTALKRNTVIRETNRTSF
ncbi:Uncharacterised protein [Streptococcus pneumoniae]|nr:Uncharacterised protein [Streptococcus pneumoniae]